MTAGVFHSLPRAKQLIEFSGLRFGTITPTDLDGLIDYHNNAFAFFEIKSEGQQMPFGQALAFTRIVTHLERAGLKAALFVAEHCERDPDRQINAARCLVQRVFTRGVWTDVDGERPLREVIDEFFASVGTCQSKA